MPLEEYLVHSRTQARARVESAGFFTPTCGRTATDFASLFGWAPRPLQQAVNNIPTELLSNPTLTIIEAPTGEGKTEAALTLAHRIGDALGSDEMYIALPTTATSNAMYGRIQEHLQDRLGLPATSARLIHGQDFLVEDDLGIAPANNDDGDDHPALSWFAPKKRALLAPFGVGTVDQVELAALNVRHNALRLIGLAGKVVILDEVHAYDTYMMTTISRMLEWLSTLGCSVILLSATLPIAKRKELVEAYTGGALAADAFEDYPLLLTTGSGEYFSASPEPIQPDRRIRVRYLNFAEEDWQGKAQWLVKQAESGGCVCWMTNTVHHAQQIFEAVREIAPPDIDCDLLHARFPISDRQKQEEKILTKYGKEENGRRPHKSIIIGTQVLEQSLDIDFDLLVSDLAPVDLLLQRIGRLHRHAQRRNRSSVHMGPIVFINAVLGDDGQLMMGADRFYTPYLLHKTWTALHERIADEEFLVLPRDYRPFVETVYDEVEPDCDSPWHNLWQDRERKESKYRDEARLRLANAPDAQQPFWKGSGHTFHEDEESNRWVVAQTRYQEQESITVIPMERLDVNQVRLVGTNDQFALGEAAGRPDQIRILRHSVRLSNYYVVTALKSEFHKGEIPPLFKQSALLKRCYPMWLEDSEWSATVSSKNVSIRLDQALGLVIEIKNPHVGGENS